MAVTKKQLTEMKRSIAALYKDELGLREEMRSIYDHFVADVGDDRLAQRYIRIAYFEIQKERFRLLLKDRLEFHPFFTASMEEEDNYGYGIDEDNEEDDGGLN